MTGPCLRLLLAAALSSSLTAASCAAAPPLGGLSSPLAARRPGNQAGHFEMTLYASDGMMLYAQGWRPHGTPRASLVIVHGLRDHGGRYAQLARELSRRGWAVFAADLRGHGRSQGRRATVQRFDQYVGDLALTVAHVRSWLPDAPLFVLGHSMGGTIASLYAERPEAVLDGLVLSAPALLSYVSVAEACGANFLADIAPFEPRLEIDLSKWSRLPRVIEDNRKDPLVYQPSGPIATGVLLLEASSQALHEAPYVRVPTLVMHGTADAITDPAGSRAFFQRIRSSDKTLKLYRGLFHDLWNEPERATLIEDLASWLEAHDKDGVSESIGCEPDCGELVGDAE